MLLERVAAGGSQPLMGRLADVGLALRTPANLAALTEDVVKTSEIEGEQLDAESVRSSIARRLGVDIGALSPVDRHAEGVVEIVLLDWLNAESSEPPLLRGGLGHLWFVTVHPIDDGNGRIARAIGDLLARGVLRKSATGGRSTRYELNDLPE